MERVARIVFFFARKSTNWLEGDTKMHVCNFDHRKRQNAKSSMLWPGNARRRNFRSAANAKNAKMAEPANPANSVFFAV
jgi:hypothetical protein